MADRFDLTRQNDLQIDQGADYKLTITFKDAAGVVINISGKTYLGDLRVTHEQVAATQAFTFAQPGGGTDGKLDVTLTNGETAALDPGLYVYDIEETVTATSKITRVMEGEAEVVAQATK